MGIDRREALKRTAMIMGGALSAPSVIAVLNGCSATPELNWVPTFFNEEHATLVMQIADDIIPKTATPGAKALGVPQFIEGMVETRYKKEDQDRFISGLAAFDKECIEKHDDKYIALSPEVRNTFLVEKNNEIKPDGRYDKKRRTFFWQMKELTLLGYFTSEVGATQVLQYKAIPVEYNGCIPLSEVGGKTWAT